MHRTVASFMFSLVPTMKLCTVRNNKCYHVNFMFNLFYFSTDAYTPNIIILTFIVFEIFAIFHPEFDWNDLFADP